MMLISRLLKMDADRPDGVVFEGERLCSSIPRGHTGSLVYVRSGNPRVSETLGTELRRLALHRSQTLHAMPSDVEASPTAHRLLLRDCSRQISRPGVGLRQVLDNIVVVFGQRV